MTLSILVAHNRYLHPGGEEAVFEAEVRLLRSRGNVVTELSEDNRRTTRMSPFGLAARTIWSVESRRLIRANLENAHPDLAHFHNTFPLFSPSVYSICHASRVAVVQTLHNYRLVCPNALLFRDGHVCEDCLKKSVPWPGVVHACYRGGRVPTAVVATMLVVHRLLRTWQRQVDVFVATSEFARGKFVEGGLPGDRIVVKPNFLYPDPKESQQERDLGPLFVGRLSVEKGVRVLLAAWSILGNIPLEIAGDGPLLGEAQRLGRARGLKGLAFLGRIDHDQVLQHMKRARFLVVPSECYENFPMVAVEAFACGLPVIGPDHGAVAETVQEGQTGLLFSHGNAGDLAAKVEWAWQHSEEMARMGRDARREYLRRYTADVNYDQLERIYGLARDLHRS